jgi:hypothetical protein
MLVQEVQAPISQSLKSLALLLVYRFSFTLFSGNCSIGVLLLHCQNLLTLMVEALDGAEVVVTAAVSFDVNAHSFQHFKLVPGTVDFKDFSLVLLVEPGHWQIPLLGVGQAKVGVVAGIFEEFDVVDLVPVFKATRQVANIPFGVGFLGKALGVFTDVLVIASDKNNGVGVDVLLEFGLEQLSESFIVHRLFLCRDLFTILIEDWRLLFRGLSLNEENLRASVVTDGVAIQNVTAILAVVLAQTPSESL